jgi:hypothetical protein
MPGLVPGIHALLSYERCLPTATATRPIPRDAMVGKHPFDLGSIRTVESEEFERSYSQGLYQVELNILELR